MGGLTDSKIGDIAFNNPPDPDSLGNDKKVKIRKAIGIDIGSEPFRNFLNNLSPEQKEDIRSALGIVENTQNSSNSSTNQNTADSSEKNSVITVDVVKYPIGPQWTLIRGDEATYQESDLIILNDPNEDVIGGFVIRAGEIGEGTRNSLSSPDFDSDGSKFFGGDISFIRELIPETDGTFQIYAKHSKSDSGQMVEIGKVMGVKGDTGSPAALAIVEENLSGDGLPETPLDIKRPLPAGGEEGDILTKGRNTNQYEWSTVNQSRNNNISNVDLKYSLVATKAGRWIKQNGLNFRLSDLLYIKASDSTHPGAVFRYGNLSDDLRGAVLFHGSRLIVRSGKKKVFGPTFSPANSQIEADSGTKITLTFAETIKQNDSGAAFTPENLKSVLTLKQTGAAGEPIEYTAAAAITDKTSNSLPYTIITLDPVEDLGDGQVYVAISDAYYDSEGNQGIAADATFTIDTAAPTVKISGVPAKINSTEPFTATFTFSKNVTGFEAEDVMVDGGLKGAFSGRGKEYRLQVTPNDGTSVVVTVEANTATDETNEVAGPTESAVKTAEWMTTGPLPPVFNPQNEAKITDSNKNIILTFAESVKADTSETDFTNNTIDSIIILKQTDETGSDIQFNATIDKTKRIVTINPTAALPDGNIYVAITDGYYNEAMEQGIAASATFTVDTSTLPPLFITRQNLEVSLATPGPSVTCQFGTVGGMPAGQEQSDWANQDEDSQTYILNKPVFDTSNTLRGNGTETNPIAVATPFTPAEKLKLEGLMPQAQSDWDQETETEPSFIRNKPNIPTKFVPSQNNIYNSVKSILVPSGINTVIEGDDSAYTITIDSPTISDDVVTSSKIKAGAVTLNKLAANSVDASKIVNKTIGADKLRLNSVTNEILATNAVESNNIRNSNITHEKLDVDSVESDNIRDGHVNHDKLATDAVESDNIKDGHVSHDKLAVDAVESDNIRDSAIITVKLNDNAVTANKLDSNAVIEAKIKDNAVTESKIKDGSVTTAKLADSAVFTPSQENLHSAVQSILIAGDNTIPVSNGDDHTIKVNFSGLTVNSSDFSGDGTPDGRLTLKAGFITSAKIGQGTVIRDNIRDTAIDATKLNENAVTEAKILNDAVTEDKIKDDAITEGKIKDDAVTEDKIKDDAVTENKIKDGVITADKLADGVVPGMFSPTKSNLYESVKAILVDGTNTEVNPDDTNKTLAIDSSDSTKLSSVSSDTTLSGDGTSVSPLAVANPFTAADKRRLDGIAEGAEVNVQSDWDATSGDAVILNKPAIITQDERDKLAGIQENAQVNVPINDDAILDVAKETRSTGDRGKYLGISEADQNELVLLDGPVGTTDLTGLINPQTITIETLNNFMVNSGSTAALPIESVSAGDYVTKTSGYKAITISKRSTVKVSATLTVRSGANDVEGRLGPRLVPVNENVTILDEISPYIRTNGNDTYTVFVSSTFTTNRDNVSVELFIGNRPTFQPEPLVLTAISNVRILPFIGPKGDIGVGDENVQADWDEDDNTSDSYIDNKPNLDDYLTTVATDNINNNAVSLDKIATPVQNRLLPAAIGTANQVLQVNSDATGVEYATPETSSGGLTAVESDSTLNGAGTSGSPLTVANPFTEDDETKLNGISEGAQVNVKPDWDAADDASSEILNKPDLHEVATSGSYTDLKNRPSQGAPAPFNPIAFSGAVTDLTGEINADPDTISGDGILIPLKVTNPLTSSNVLSLAKPSRVEADRGKFLAIKSDDKDELDVVDAPTFEIGAGTVTNDKLAANSVTSDKIAANAVMTAEIADGAVSGNKIADTTITAGKIANTTITNDKIKNATITGAKIASNTITDANLADNSVGTSQIANDAVDLDKLADAIVARLLPATLGSGGQILQVNSGGTAVEYGNAPAVPTNHYRKVTKNSTNWVDVVGTADYNANYIYHITASIVKSNVNKIETVVIRGSDLASTTAGIEMKLPNITKVVGSRVSGGKIQMRLDSSESGDFIVTWNTFSLSTS